MNAGILLAVFTAILVAGVAFVVGTYILPSVPSPQTMVSHGPIVPYGNSSYTISGYFFPPIAKGEQVTLNISGYKPGTITISFFPSAEGSVSPTGSPLLFQPNLAGTSLNVVLTSTGTQAYGMYVTSENRSTFTLTVSSTWSPFYFLRGYVSEGIFMVLLGGLGVVYFRGAKRREEEYKKVLEEVRSRKASSASHR
jgi:hypothetical protein